MEQLTIQYPTDTTHPQQSIPMYLIHSLQQPFCNNADCWCQTNKANIVPLLAAITQGDMLLHEAATFADGSAI